jgi:uncharacterized protein YkwD
MLVAALLAGCGGGDDGATPASAANPDPMATGSAATQAAGDPPTSPAPQGKTGGILDALNQARSSARSCGGTSYPAALPLAVDGDAEEAADAHTRWMQANRVMSHTGDSGSSVGTRLTATGYRWSAVGENVAMGQATPAAVVAAWLASPGHCANIMNTAFVDVGFGFAPAASGVPTYATLVLARPR